LSFKSGMKTLPHTVTCQALHPLLQNAASSPSRKPVISYFEIKVMKMADKQFDRFGIGLAKANFPHLRTVGSMNSVGIRGDGHIYCNDEKDTQARVFGRDPQHLDTGLVDNILGCGYESKSGTVFFTFNGKEIHSMVAAQTL